MFSEYEILYLNLKKNRLALQYRTQKMPLIVSGVKCISGVRLVRRCRRRTKERPRGGKEGKEGKNEVVWSRPEGGPTQAQPQAPAQGAQLLGAGPRASRLEFHGASNLRFICYSAVT